MALTEWLTTNEPGIRVACFVAAVAIMVVWELISPRRELTVCRALRWANNLGLVVLNTLVVRLVFPTAAVGVTLLVTTRGWGWGNNVDLPGWMEFLVMLLLLDLAIYFQHRMMHWVPLFWRLHRVHHADLDIDLTTGIRFHPLEILLSMVVKFGVILVLGPTVATVIVFEVLLNATAIFNHANVLLPARLDRLLRWILVTPDMHRVHHSVDRLEADHNFGFNLPWWDHLFGTYQPQPRAGHLGMTIGVPEFRAAGEVTLLPGILRLPFVNPK